MAAVHEMKHEWRQFRRDAPGARFLNHRRRMKRKPTWVAAVRLGLGIALVTAGVAFLFLPGPGLVGIVFGVALLAGMSTRLARLMDRAEPWLRARARALRRGWRQLSRAGKGAVIAGAAALAVAAGVVVWTQWLGPRLTG